MMNWVGTEPTDLRPRAPFNAAALAFLDDLSKALRTDSDAKNLADIMALAFWCRKSHLMQLRDRFSHGHRRLGRGLAFHITPSNVPVNFAYSFAFGLLAGNTNIVRMPSTDSFSLNIVLSALAKLMEKPAHADIAKSNAFVRYERGSTATDRFSAKCAARIIWGGDAAINDVRRSPIPARAVEMTFADRYSFAVLSENTVSDASDEDIEALATAFYNDAYLMDQNACSSPHLVVWLDGDGGSGRERFWAALDGVVADRYDIAPVQAVDKYTRLLANFATGPDQHLCRNDIAGPTRVDLRDLPDNVDELRGSHGLFYEYTASELDDIGHIVNEKYQTLAYYGLEKAALSDFVTNGRLTGIDRIVPIGTALDIDTIWDGVDVLGTLSRIIDVR